MNEEARAFAALETEAAWSKTMAIYGEEVRMRRYNIKPSVNTACTTADSARILRSLMPSLTVEEHRAIANVHLDMAARALTSWSTIVNLASLETFGRRYETWDYKVSGIARDEFSNVRKEQLRVLMHAATKHNRAASAHEALAGRGRGLRPLPREIEQRLALAV